MPKKRRGNFGSAEAKRKKASRGTETAVERENRLSGQRQRQDLCRTRETDNETAERLELERQRSERHRFGETSTESTERLELQRQRTERRRAEETSTESTERLQLQRQRDDRRRAEETSTESTERLQLQRQRDERRRAEETSTESTERLQLQRQRDERRRAEETSTESTERLQLQRQRDERRRAEETSAESTERLQLQQQRTERRRADETSAESTERLELQRQRDERRRGAETSAETDVRLQRQQSSDAQRLSNESVEARSVRQTRNRDAQTQRRRRSIQRSNFIARRNHEIFQGAQIVTSFDIGPLKTESDGVVKCDDCHALKFKSEPAGFCCGGGKTKLAPLFDINNQNLQHLRELWTVDDAKSRIFRKHCVTLNNALSLAALKVRRVRPTDGGWCPSVVIQGKVAIQCGPLRPTDGRSPVFSQLYVLDPEATNAGELQLRQGTMLVNRRISAQEEAHLEDLLGDLQDLMHRCNPYVADFKLACERYEDEQSPEVRLLIDANQRPTGEHARRYGEGFKEICVVIDDRRPVLHHFVLSLRGQGNAVRSVSDANRAVDSWRFPVFFPTGIDGWHCQLARNQGEIDAAHALNEAAIARGEQPTVDVPVAAARCTGRMFYSFHLQIRDPPDSDYFNQLFYGGNLFQEYLCLSAAKIENQELFWIRNNQKTLRADKYKNVMEDLHAHDAAYTARPPDEEGNQPPDPRLGQMIVLPPSHTGSPRFMHGHHQDAMAIVRENKKPDFFITMTCNPQWPEIKDSLLGSQQPHDRPDLVARVFRRKLVEFHHDLIQRQKVGKIAGQVNVIEFQKRGLPHNHLLLILSAEDRLRTADDVDAVISAELPPDPATLPEDQQPQAERLLQLVLKHMVHTCSQRCRAEGVSKDSACKKGFPRPFCPETKWNDNAYYPEYRRHEGHSVYNDHGVLVTNRDIVPYNPYFLLKYDAHINFECCISVSSVKYLYKYVYKGPDRLMVAADVDEVTQYQDLRSIGSAEACWRIFEFPITDRQPSVTALRIHLDQEQVVFFNEGDVRDVVAEGPKPTELTAFFAFNKDNPTVHVKYVDFPKNHVLDKSGMKWRPRKQGKSIGRVHSVHPNSGDVFYLRILLHHEHCMGKTSFKDLRTIGDIEYPTYKDVCRALGLLADDGEWNLALEEAAVIQSSCQLRKLFQAILLFNKPANPLALFENHQAQWVDDFKRRFPDASTDDLRLMVLQNLQIRLQEGGKDLSDYNLPCPTEDQYIHLAQLQQVPITTKDSVIMQEEQNFDLEQTIQEHAQNVQRLYPEQRNFYDEVMDVIQSGGGSAFFLDARGGTGKTFTLNTLLAGARTRGGTKHVALAVASSGIASLLLTLGRTFHSRFGVPVTSPDENTTFRIKPNDSVAKVICACQLIVWDEGPMIHRHLLEALDRTLRDITDNQSLPFGGKVLVIAGDFRQVLPVIKKASRAQITQAALHKSVLWRHFKIRHLSRNMRIGNEPQLQEFDQYLEKMGDGQLPIVEESDWIALPEDSVVQINDSTTDTLIESLCQFVDIIFPDIEKQSASENWSTWVSERAILAPKNSEVDSINEWIVSQFPGQLYTLTSADDTVEKDDSVEFPLEFLNEQIPSGMPPHHLLLKKGVVIILLRNLNPREGLCNGTRLIVDHVGQRYLACTIVAGSRQGDQVLVPRIDLIIDEPDFPLKWRRRQFPVRPAFAMTINKSQGQTLFRIGVWLREPCFSHGQLYVASSRVGHPQRIHYAITHRDNGLTRNVVYSDALPNV